jgi:MFS family permease
MSWILMNFTGPIPQTYSSLFFEGLGANYFLLGVIGFAGSIAIALVQFPGGYLADRHGRRLLVVVMTYGVALSTLFFIFAPSWQFIVLGVVISNFCMLYQPAMYAIMMDSVAPEYRGQGFMFQAVVTNLFSLPAALIAGYLVLVFNLDFGMRLAYAIVLIGYLIAATLRIRLKETLPSNSAESFPSVLVVLREYPKSVRESLEVWSKVPKAVFYLFLTNAAMNSLIVGCQVYFVVYATSFLHVSFFQWALVMAFMAVSILIPSILAGMRMDVTGRKKFLILGFLLVFPAMLIFLSASFYTLLVCVFLFGLAQMLMGTAYTSLVGDLTPRELRGKVIGCSQFFMYMGQAFASLLVGALYAYVTPQTPFILLGIAAIPIAAIAYFKVSDTSAKQV